MRIQAIFFGAYVFKLRFPLSINNLQIICILLSKRIQCKYYMMSNAQFFLSIAPSLFSTENVLWYNHGFNAHWDSPSSEN